MEPETQIVLPLNSLPIMLSHFSRLRAQVKGGWCSTDMTMFLVWDSAIPQCNEHWKQDGKQRLELRAFIVKGASESVLGVPGGLQFVRVGNALGAFHGYNGWDEIDWKFQIGSTTFQKGLYAYANDMLWPQPDKNSEQQCRSWRLVDLVMKLRCGLDRSWSGCERQFQP